MTDASPGTALFLQPQCDATLSCGGAAARLAAAGWDVKLVTVFAHEPQELRRGTSDAALKARCSDAVTLRQSEAALAAQALGCSSRWLGLPPARRLCNHTHRDARVAAHLVARELLRLEDWREGAHVFVPLGAPRSPDLRLVFEAGRVLARHGVTVWAYDDLSCSLHAPEVVRARLGQVCRALGKPLLVSIHSMLARKLDALEFHARQLRPVFASVSDVRRAVIAHAREVGARHGEPCERFWSVVR